MESKVHALMNDDDIKLSLFVSLKKGEGSVLFKSMWQKMKNQGYNLGDYFIHDIKLLNN